MSTRVRFAPSPTGQVHIGNIRTAIFNWLFARHSGGEFLLRIEDTDRERSTPEAIEQLLSVMAWLGLDYDGEPLHQSRQVAAHLGAADRLLETGQVYRYAKGEGEEAVLFGLPVNLAGLPFVVAGEEVEIEPHPDEPLIIDRGGVTFALPSKKGKPMPQAGSLAGFQGLLGYRRSGKCIVILDNLIDEIMAGERVEFDAPARLTYRRHYAVFRDAIKGELRKPLESMKDFVIVRSDGSPVFHLANVCDDIEQGISHILRGDDHVENTFRHLFLFHALGGEAPTYGHFPMIVNEQGKPYSKRDGDAFVGDFLAKGYLPDALFNYLTLLGWAPGDDREKMSREELIEAFTLERCGSAAAQMDLRKLDNLNGQYMAEVPFERFLERAREEVVDLPWANAADPVQFEAVASLLHSRTKRWTDVRDWRYFFVDQIEYDEQDVKKALRKAGMAEKLSEVRRRLAEVDFDEEAVEAAIHAAEEAMDVKQGKLNLPIRVAVTGTRVGAGMYETLCLIGRERVLRRLDHAIEELVYP